MFRHLQIYDPRERLIVGVADGLLTGVAALGRLLPGPRPRPGAPPVAPARILLLRLERIGDLLMSGAAIEAVRSVAPSAAIDLVVGSWNLEVARCLRGIDRVETLDAPWLARGAAGGSAADLVRRAWTWRARSYDLAINFEGDIRSHALVALSGAAQRVGFDMAGGGPLLTRRVDHRTDEHTAINAARLVDAAFGVTSVEARTPFALAVPDAARTRAASLVPPRCAADCPPSAWRP